MNRVSRIILSMLTTVVLFVGLGVSHAQKGSKGDGGTSGYVIVQLDDGDYFVGSPSAGAFDISDRGNVVGQVTDPENGNGVAAFWQITGTSSTLYTLAGGFFAYGLNNYNEIVGIGPAPGDTLTSCALYWPSPTSDPVPLPSLETDLAAVAYAINDDGIICGYAVERVRDETGDVVGTTDMAVVWRVAYPDGKRQISGPFRLPTLDDRSQAYDLNQGDSDGVATVVGTYMTAWYTRTAAVAWTVRANADGTLDVAPDPVPLQLGAAAAFGVNNSGAVCGQIPVTGSEPKGRIWTDSGDRTLADPSTKPGYAGRPLHVARGINEFGVTVGSAGVNAQYYDAVVWPSALAQPVTLNSYLPRRNSPFDGLSEGISINKSGVIVGVGWKSGAGKFGFMAVPK